ncbi:MAG: plasmid stabilization protein StbC [Burkholderia sp.]
MDKPPTKEEVIFEWFLGDSKEIVAELKTAIADAANVRDGIGKAKGELDATVQAATRELVTAHRELAQVIREAKATQTSAAQAVQAHVGRAAAAGIRDALPLLAACCGVSSLVGAAIAVAVVRLLI